tara:strand:+ start:34 stop:390 length:357 start_codon:yes stop_codon:yes gene_type:complete
MSTRKEMIVCPNCGGRGITTNPSIYPVGGGFTQSEWNEMDSEFQDTYMDGGYDVRCRECRGRNVIEIEIRTICVAFRCEGKIPIDRQGWGEVYCCDDCAKKDYNDSYDIQAAERAVGC